MLLGPTVQHIEQKSTCINSIDIDKSCREDVRQSNVDVKGPRESPTSKNQGVKMQLFLAQLCTQLTNPSLIAVRERQGQERAQNNASLTGSGSGNRTEHRELRTAYQYLVPYLPIDPIVDDTGV